MLRAVPIAISIQLAVCGEYVHASLKKFEDSAASVIKEIQLDGGPERVQSDDLSSPLSRP